MKYKISVLLWITLTLLNACNIPTGDYSETLNKFPSKFVSHFPKKLGIEYSMDIITDPTNKCIELILYEFNLDIEEELKHILDAGSFINYYSANDSNLIIIRSNSDFEFGISEKKYYQNIYNNNQTYYPVPYFSNVKLHNLIKDVKDEEVSSSFTSSGLSENFKIYILESRTGCFWKGLNPLDYMPDGWKNGFSRGIAINTEKNIFVYWLVIW